MQALSSNNALGLFITVGTSLDPFDRMLRLVDELFAEGHIPALSPALAQSGTCRFVPQNYPIKPFFAPEDLEAYVQSAHVILCHGGAGILGTCQMFGRRPVVLPRRAAFGEIINDHQLELCRRMAADDRIFLANDKNSLAQALLLAHTRAAEPLPYSGGGKLKAAIADLLQKLAYSKTPI